MLLDTIGKKPKDNQRDPRLLFHYNMCWAKDNRAKEIIKESWHRRGDNILEKLDGMRGVLGYGSLTSIKK